jgi:protein-tyrosine phosphatase
MIRENQLMSQIKVLFCCMGNICRSPTAHGVFEGMVKEAGLSDRIVIDSAGTHAYHVGEAPDRRSQETARRRGYDLSHQRARKVKADDFLEFDYVLAMDQDNYHNLHAICPSGYEERLSLFLDFAPELGQREVPDPYYGGGNGFEQVFDLVEAASRGLLIKIQERI